MITLIVHADDFGLSANVNECIDTCFITGALSETSLMVNMPCASNAVEMARKAGYDNRVGLHLNLTEGTPLTDDILREESFCGKDGRFNKVFHLSRRKRLWLSGRERNALRKEIVAQIERFCDYNGLMMRIDSHHHVHTDWPVYSILRELAPSYGFSSMRISANVGAYSIGKNIYKFLLNRSIKRNFKTTNWFGGYSLVARKMRGEADGVCEVMVHPLYSESREILDTSIPYADVIEKLKTDKNAEIMAWHKD